MCVLDFAVVILDSCCLFFSIFFLFSQPASFSGSGWWAGWLGVFRLAPLRPAWRCAPATQPAPSSIVYRLPCATELLLMVAFGMKTWWWMARGRRCLAAAGGCAQSGKPPLVMWEGCWPRRAWLGWLGPGFEGGIVWLLALLVVPSGLGYENWVVSADGKPGFCAWGWGRVRYGILVTIRNEDSGGFALWSRCFRGYSVKLERGGLCPRGIASSRVAQDEASQSEDRTVQGISQPCREGGADSFASTFFFPRAAFSLEVPCGFSI